MVYDIDGCCELRDERRLPWTLFEARLLHVLEAIDLSMDLRSST